MIIGFVLGRVVEKYLYISILTYGRAWLVRPGVLLLILLTVAAIGFPIIKKIRAKQTLSGGGIT